MAKTLDRQKDFAADRLLLAFGALAFAATAYYFAAFFTTLNMGLSDWSWGDIIWVNQAFWNFIHGRALQTSVYCRSGDGVVFNPWSYSSQIAMHVNWFPYVFSPLYRLKPDINGLYAIVLAWNYLGIGWFTWKTVKHLSAEDAGMRFFVVLSLLMTGSFFPIFAYKTLFLLYAGPLISALVYFLVSRQKAAFILTGVLLCLVAEDAAMFAVAFSAYVFLFHREERSYAYWLGGFAVLYIALVIFVLMPATKLDLTLATKDSSDIVIRFKKMLSGQYALAWRSLIPMVLFIVSGFAMLAAFFTPSERTDRRRIAGLVLLAPSTHWLISLTQGTGHHPLPVAVCALAAMAYYAATARRESRHPLAGFAVGLALLAFNARWITKNLVRPFSARGEAVAAQVRSNEAFLAAAAALPRDASVSYWTNRGLDGFLSSRSDVWRFPINFDKTDYLLIQKDGDQSFFELKVPFDLAKVEAEGTPVFAGKSAPSAEAAAWLKKGLSKTHEVAAENEHLLFLKRRERHDFPMPAFSLGFGWAANIPKLRSRKGP